MVVKVRMPRVDANVDEATLGRWLVGPGEAIVAGRPLVEIITDKASFELEAECGGVFRRRLAAEKSVVPVGYVLGLVSDAGDEPLPDVGEENAAVMAAYRQSLLEGGPRGGETAPPGGTQGASDTVWATPAARRLALQEGLSLDELAAHIQGVIQRSDVEVALRRLRGGGK